MNDKKSVKREQLIWNNKYYGGKQRRIIKNFRVIRGFGTPPHFSNKHYVNELNKYVQFSKEVIEYLNK